MSDEAPKKGHGLRRKLVVGGVATTAALGLAVPVAFAQESDDAPTTEEAPEPDGDRAPFQRLVDEGVLSEEQATAVHDAFEAAKEGNEDLSREERQELKQSVLDGLVSDGTIDEEEAQAIEDARPRRGHHGGRNLDTVAEVVGIEPDALREQLQGGSSIADVAEANDVDSQTVIDALVAEMNERIAQGLEDGRLTEDEAAEKQANAAEKAEERVNRTGGERPMPQDGDDEAPAQS